MWNPAETCGKLRKCIIIIKGSSLPHPHHRRGPGPRFGVATKSIRILLSIAAHLDYEIWQMDVKTVFLNGHLEEDIYMMQPDGFVAKNQEQKICKLQKSIYGLKQASRARTSILTRQSKHLVLSKSG